MFWLSFESMAELLQLLEQDKESWCHSAIVGHSKTSILFPFTRMEKQLLFENNIITISQLFKTNEINQTTREFNNTLAGIFAIRPLIIHKLKLLHKAVLTLQVLDQAHTTTTFAAFLLEKK